MPQPYPTTTSYDLSLYADLSTLTSTQRTTLLADLEHASGLCLHPCHPFWDTIDAQTHLNATSVGSGLDEERLSAFFTPLAIRYAVTFTLHLYINDDNGQRPALRFGPDASRLQFDEALDGLVSCLFTLRNLLSASDLQATQTLAQACAARALPYQIVTSLVRHDTTDNQTTSS